MPLTSIIYIISGFIFLLLLLLGTYFGWRLLSIRMRTTQFTIVKGLEKGEFDQGFLESEKTVIRIEKEDGSYLSGWEFTGNSNKTIVFCHGITWTRYGMVKYYDYFRDNGWNIIAYDHQGHGESPGGYPTYGWKEKVDLKTVTDWARTRFPNTEVLGVYGESMGGGTVLQYAPLDDKLNFVIADCPYTDYKKLLNHQLKLNYIPGFLYFPVRFIAERITFAKAGFYSGNIDPAGDMMKTKVPLLLCHGDMDNYVPTSMSEELYDKRKEYAPTELLLIEGAGHAEAIMINPEKYKKKVKEFIESLGY